MNIPKLSTVIVFTVGIFLSSNPANAQGCTLQGVELKCNEKAKTAEAIMTAFASEETRALLANPLSQVDRFSKKGDLEKYRQSMERNWRVITRHARTQQRNKNRRRITEAEFQAFSNHFNEAEKTYKVALSYYRELHWQGLK